MPAYEDEHGTYIMNSKDLRAVQHVQRLIDIGVDSLKIEGRTKSHYYVARTAQIYRSAIDAADRGDAFNMEWMAELDHLANRGYTEGFYRRHVPEEYQNYTQGVSTNPNQQFVGEVSEIHEAEASLLIDVKNKFRTNETLQLVTPEGNIAFVLPALQNKRGASIDEAPGSGHYVHIPISALGEQTLSRAALSKALLMRHIP